MAVEITSSRRIVRVSITLPKIPTDRQPQTCFGIYPVSGLRLGCVPSSIHTREYDRFRALLIDLRKRAGLSQAELAKRLAKPQSFVSKFERGERRLDVIEFKTVAEALGIDPLRLLRRLYTEAR